MWLTKRLGGCGSNSVFAELPDMDANLVREVPQRFLVVAVVWRCEVGGKPGKWRELGAAALKVDDETINFTIYES